MIELLFLLLPVAAVYGYYMGRASLRSKQLKSKNFKNSKYLQGVEYLLSHDREKAADKFIDYLKLTTPSFESGLALGNLLRQRGEIDKAIALHEKMISGQNLDESEHELAQQELARDFMHAGLFDRAEDILMQLIEIPRQRHTSAELLLKLCEREHDYESALKLYDKYRDAFDDRIKPVIAEYYCEIASSCLTRGDEEQCESLLKKALAVNPSSNRPRFALAELYLRRGFSQEASLQIKAATEQDPRCGLLCLAYLKKCYQNQTVPGYRKALEDLVKRSGSAEVAAELVRVVEREQGSEAAQSLLLGFLKEKSSLKLFSAFVELHSHDQSTSAEVMMQLKSLFDAQIAVTPRYVCRKCGFESSFMFWQCPSCRRWETLKPKSGIDGD